MLQVSFRVRRDRHIATVSAAHPRCKLVVWCNLRSDLVEVQAPTPKLADALVADLAEPGETLMQLGAPEGAQRAVLMGCPQDVRRSVGLLLEEHGGIMLPPLVVEGGWETFRAALFEESRAPAFFRALGALAPFEMLSKRRLEAPFVREAFMLSTAELLGGLTGKQSEALLLALEEGYYRVPRTANLQDIAARRGVPRTTLEEHLRKAEGKLMTALGPFVALRLHGAEPAPSRPRPRRRSAREPEPRQLR